MPEKGFKRKLTAILSADVVGYSRMMRDDEDSTIRTLANYRSAMSNLIQKFRGHVVDATGDNLMAEFTSVADAVNCAVEIQRELAERNTELPENRKMNFRIGVNLGDVVKEEDRIYGDGVNIAARMEGLALAGGICISGSVYDSVESRLGLEYEFLGEQEVKNIDKPVRAYRVLSFPGAAAHRVVQAKAAFGKKWRKLALVATASVVVIAGAIIWNSYFRPFSTEKARIEKMAFPLPDKSSIAVLPFENLGGDPEEEYFSDGITEEIITALSKISNLFVIARNSTFTYKGKPVKVQQVGRELGVEYVLEGSVRKVGEKVRVTVQLVEAKTGNHLWAERYDRNLKDIFAIQDEITMKIITALRVQLTDGEQARVMERHSDNLQSYLKILEGYGYFSEAKFTEAMECFEEALTLDAQNPVIYGAIAWTHIMNVWFGSSATRATSLQKAFEFAKKSKTLDDELDTGHMILGNVYLLKREYDKAISEGRRATELNPNSWAAAIFFGQTLRYVGRYEDAVREYERAIRLNPLQTAWPLTQLSLTYVMMVRHEEAIAICKQVVQLYPKSFVAYIALAMAYSELNRLDEARAAASEVLKLIPNFSVDDFEKTLPCKNEADRVFMAGALRKAGLP